MRLVNFKKNVFDPGSRLVCSIMVQIARKSSFRALHMLQRSISELFTRNSCKYFLFKFLVKLCIKFLAAAFVPYRWKSFFCRKWPAATRSILALTSSFPDPLSIRAPGRPWIKLFENFKKHEKNSKYTQNKKSDFDNSLIIINFKRTKKIF